MNLNRLRKVGSERAWDNLRTTNSHLRNFKTNLAVCISFLRLSLEYFCNDLKFVVLYFLYLRLPKCFLCLLFVCISKKTRHVDTFDGEHTENGTKSLSCAFSCVRSSRLAGYDKTHTSRVSYFVVSHSDPLCHLRLYMQRDE